MLIVYNTHGTPLRGPFAPSSLSVNLVWIVLLQIIKGVWSSCPLHTCNGDFGSNTRGLKDGPYHPYCTHLDTYIKCVEHLAKDCYGNLLFHGTKISVETLLINNNCEKVLQQPPEQNPQPKEDPLNNEVSYRGSQDDPCKYYGRSHLAHCGLFGDPHLKTFNNTFQTCRVRGAWPMLSSKYLAIQVTNEPVGKDLKATATTKVTVLVKEDPHCGGAKTYEASREELPKAFVDGTTFSGSDRSDPYVQVIEALPGQHVVIKVKKINSTVNVRRVGKYLTVSVTAPREIVDSMRGDMQLCDQGCPDSELLETGGSFKKLKATVMSQAKAQSLCSEYNVTDFYLDSCVFDLMMTGDVTFRDAAYLALRDMWHNDPKASFLVLKNCTIWPCSWHTANTGSSNTATVVAWFFISILVYLI